jgi:hypothetical protein
MKRMKISASLFPLILGFALAAGGTAFAQAVESVTDVDGENAETASLVVETNIARAEVYIDSVYQGLTPLTITGIAPGLRRVEIAKNGYYRIARTVRITRGKKTTLYSELVPITGVLSVTGAPAGTQLEIDGKTYDATRVELHEGAHTVIIRAFGYIEKKTTITVFRGIDNILPVNLEKAPFAATNLTPAHAAFNPENPANLGMGILGFEVTGPGRGKITFTDATGREVRTCAFARFTTWRQTASWDGKDSAGQSLPDGVYTATLDTAGSMGENPTKLVTTIAIDRTIRYPLTGLLGGTGATGEVISASLMPAGSAIVALDIGCDSGTIMPGISLSAGVLPNLEAGLRVGAFKTISDEATADLSATVKAGFGTGPFRIAAALSYSALVTADESVAGAGKRGIGFTPAFEFRSGDFACGLDAGIRYGDARGLFADPDLRASGGISARYAGRIFGLGLWSSVTTGAIGPGFTLLQTVDSGAQAQFFVPATNLVLTFGAGWRVENLTNGTLVIGGGFGAIF